MTTIEIIAVIVIAVLGICWFIERITAKLFNIEY